MAYIWPMLAAVALAAQASQPVPAERLTLWNNLYAGMSKAEFKALWPKRVTPLGDGCFADIGAGFNRGKLNSVTLEYSLKDTNERCAEVVSKSLHSKYGEPVALATNVEVGDCGPSNSGGIMGALAALCEGMGGEDPKTNRFYRWISEGVEVTLKLSADSESQWWLEYRPAVTASSDVKNSL